MMTAADCGVRVIKPFMQFNTGFVMYPTAIYRAELLRRGWVEEVKPDAATPVESKNQSKPTLKLRR